MGYCSLAKAMSTRPRARAPEVEGPDGGWGWVVVGSLFFGSALVFGMLRSLGVFFVEFVRYFEESAQAISWITSIAVATQQLFSPLATALCNAFGARPVVMAGGFLSALGLILASQATCVTHLYLTMGSISGLGWALVFTPTVASVMQYFTRRRSLAMALGFTGIGISSFAFSPLFQLLVEEYAWRGALLILGAMSLNIVACGALIRPRGPPKGLTQMDAEGRPLCVSTLQKVCSYLELSLLLQRPFLTYSLAITLFNAGYFVPYVHLVAHSRTAGFSEYQAAFIISATGATDIVGRVASGWVSDLGRLRLLHLLSLWTGLTGAFLFLLPLGGSYPALLVLGLAYGFCGGAMTPLVFSVVPEIVGMERMVGALGLLQLIESVGGLLGAPLSGLLKDLTGSYVASFMVAGGFLLLGTVVMATLPRFCSCTTPPPAQKRPPHTRQEEDPSPDRGLMGGPLGDAAEEGHPSGSSPNAEPKPTHNGLRTEGEILGQSRTEEVL